MPKRKAAKKAQAKHKAARGSKLRTLLKLRPKNTPKVKKLKLSIRKRLMYIATG